jgi:hypothetical protein
MPRMAFEIRVAGVIPNAGELLGIASVAVAVEPTTTLLGGIGTDEAALFGLLPRLREMGLEIIEIRRFSP